LIGIGLLFLINSIFGRYLVLPGYIKTLEEGMGTVNPSLWGIIRYVLWGYSFKMGIFFTITGTLINSSMKRKKFWLFVIFGIIYLNLAFVPIPGPFSLFFGIGGGLITVLFLLIIYRWYEERKNLSKAEQKATDFRIVGYFFFAMATYNLCGLMGVSAFALHPEKMMQYGLQSRAVSYASHVMIELVLGWLFIYLSYKKADT